MIQLGAQISLGCEETAQVQWVEAFEQIQMKQVRGGRAEQSSYIRPLGALAVKYAHTSMTQK